MFYLITGFPFVCLKYYAPTPPNAARDVRVRRENICSNRRQMFFLREAVKQYSHR